MEGGKIVTLGMLAYGLWYLNRKPKPNIEILNKDTANKGITYKVTMKGKSYTDTYLLSDVQPNLVPLGNGYYGMAFSKPALGIMEIHVGIMENGGFKSIYGKIIDFGTSVQPQALIKALPPHKPAEAKGFGEISLIELNKKLQTFTGNEAAGIGKAYTDINKVLNRIYAKPNGKEKGVNEVIYFGVSDTPYAYRTEANKAGIEYTEGRNSLFVYPDRENMRKLLTWLLNNDGYLDIS
jgi:hypothetical protein